MQQILRFGYRKTIETLEYDTFDKRHIFTPF